MDLITDINNLITSLGFYDNGWLVEILGEFFRCALIIATFGLPIIVAVGFIIFVSRLAYDYK